MADEWRNMQVYPPHPGPSGAGIWYTIPEPDPDLDLTDRPTDGSSGPDIEELHRQIMNQHPEDISALADQWHNAWSLMNDVEQQLLRTSDTLYQQDWQDGEARDAFMVAGPGKTLAYLREWMNSAMDNVTALRAQVQIVRQSRADMETLYDEYLDRLDEAQHVDTSTRLWEGFWHYNLIPGGDQSEYENAVAAHRVQQINDVKKEFARRAQELVWPVAQSIQGTYGRVNNGHGPPFMPMNALMTPIGAVIPNPPSMSGLPGTAPGLPPSIMPAPLPTAPPALTGAVPQQPVPQPLTATPLVPAGPPAVPTGQLNPAHLVPPPVPSALSRAMPGTLPGLPGGGAAAAAGTPAGLRSPSARPNPGAGGLSRGLIQGRGLPVAPAETTPGALRSPAATTPPPPMRGGRSQPRQPPGLKGREQPGGNIHQRAGTDETFGGSSVPTAPPVLNNQRPAGQQPPGSRGALPPTAPTRPDSPTPLRPAGTVSPVLGSPGQSPSPVPPPAPTRSGRGTPGRPGAGHAGHAGQPGRPAPDSEWVGVTEATADVSAPILDAPAPPRPGAVPRAEEARLRGRAATTPAPVRGRPASIVPPELTARRAMSESTPAVEDGQRIITDEEAFTVDTPGGGVVAKRPEDTSYRVEPPSALGGNG